MRECQIAAGALVVTLGAMAACRSEAPIVGDGPGRDARPAPQASSAAARPDEPTPASATPTNGPGAPEPTTRGAESVDPPVAPTAVPAAPASLRDAPRAPTLAFAEWVDGRDPTEPGRPKVVAAWATWCPGCVAETPLLSALAKRYAGKVDVFALDDEPAATVKAYSARLREPMTRTFPIALEPTGASRSALYEAVGARQVLPHLFIVHAGRIVWHGNGGDVPAAIDEVLATGDAAAARGAESTLPLLRAKYEREYHAGGTAAAQHTAERLLATAHGHADFLNDLAWTMVDGDTGADLAFALVLAKEAVDASAGTSSAILDTYGLALWKNGRKTEARTTQQRAVELCDASAASCKDERQRLAEFTRGS